MNRRLYRLSVLIIGFQTISSLAISMPDMKVEPLPNGKYRILGCGFKAGESFSLQYGQNGIPSFRKITSQGCVDETLTAMTSSITEMVITYKGEKQAVPVRRSQAQNPPKSKSSGGYTRPTQPTSPAWPSSGGYVRPEIPKSASQPTKPAPAPVQLKKIAVDTVRSKADQAAKQFVERVLRVYGAIERARIGVRAGLEESNRAFESYKGDITRIPEFAQAMRQGTELGRVEGSAYGERMAQENGTRAGAIEADQRFTKAAESDAGAPDLTYSVIAPELPDLKPEVKTQGLDMRAALGSLNDDLQTSIRSILESGRVPTRVSDQMISTYFTMESIWGRGSQREIRDAFSSPGSAFDVWSRGNEPGLVPDLEIQQWLAMVSDSSVYDQAQSGVSNRELFRRTFTQTYADEFNKRWDSFVRESDGNIADGSRELGKKLFQKVLVNKAREIGTDMGYTREYNSAVKRSFKEGYVTFAQHGFNDLVDRYQRNAVLSGVQMKLMNPSARDLAPGDALSLKIEKALNKGMKPLAEQIRVTSPGLVVSGEAPVVRMSGLSHVKESEPIVVDNFAQVAANAPFGQEFEAKVQVGTAQENFKFIVTVKGAVQKISEVGRAAAPEAATAILQALRAEWDQDAGSIGTIYDNGDTKLDEVVNAVAALSAERQAKFTSEMLEEIRKAYPPQPEPGWLGRAFDKSADDYEGIQTIMARVHWTLKK